MTDQPGAGAPGAGPPMSERMQALLSRAVEDQVSEQRQMQAVLGEIRTLLGQLPAQVAAAAAPRPTDDTATEHLRARLDDLAGRITLLSQRIDALSSATETRSKDDSSLLAVVGAVQTATETLLTRLDALNQRVDEVATRTADPEASQSAADAAARLGAVEGRLGELTQGMAEVQGRLSGLTNVVAGLPDDVRSLSDRVESRVASRLDPLDGLSAGFAALQASTDDTALRAELSQVRAALADLAARPSLAEDREGVVLAVQQVLGESVRSTVADEVARSEERVRGHVDAAVLALAEALLKRRTTPAAAHSPAPAPTAGGTAAEPDPAEPEPAAVEPLDASPYAGDAPAGPPVQAPGDDDAGLDVLGATDDGAADAADDRTDYGTDDGAVEGEVLPESAGPPDDDDGASRRRRAWWRPGE